MGVGEVGVAGGGAVAAVAEQPAHQGQVLARHDGLAGRRVAQVVQAQPAEAGIGADRPPARREAVGAPAFGVSRKQEGVRVAGTGQRLDERPRGRGKLMEADETGGFDLALRADGFYVETESEAVSNEGSTTGVASRVRLALEGSRAFEMGGGVLTPGLEVGLRHDGGDAETGTGVELGGRVSWSDPDSGLSMEARVRTLIAHEDSDYREWGLSGSVRYAPGEGGRGLSVRVGSAWGAAAGGAERIWAQSFGGFSPGAFDPEASLDAEAGYGFDTPRGLLTPYTGVALTGSGETWRAGARWKLGPAFDLALEASLTEPADGEDTESGVLLKGSKRW